MKDSGIGDAVMDSRFPIQMIRYKNALRRCLSGLTRRAIVLPTVGRCRLACQVISKFLVDHPL